MNSFVTLLLAVLLVAASAQGAPLDDYYLGKFNLTGSQPRPYGISAQAEPHRYRCRTWLYHDLRRDWSRLEPQTQKVLAKVLPARPVWTGEATVDSSGGHFRVRYTTSAPDAPPSVNWVHTVAETFEEVYARMVALGYTPAPTVDGAPYDVYLQNVGSPPLKEFGETNTAVSVTATSFTSYIIIDNDFSRLEFGDQITDYDPQKALQITATHEYHHAIQYGYNRFFQSWYAEATSTWIEDEIFDDVNQLYNYLPNYMRNTTSNIDIDPDVNTGGGYARWIFNRHLAERFDTTVVRDIWERLRALPPPANVNDDIPMLPVIDTVLSGKGSSLDAEFFLFSEKVYTRDWTSHVNDLDLLHPVVPQATYSTYPVNNSSTPVPNVTLPRYAFAYYAFQPAASAPATLALAVKHSSGIRIAGFRKSTSDVIAEFPPDGNGVIIVPSFTSGTLEAVLLVTNSSASEGMIANFSTDNTTPPAAAPSSGGDGGGGGCFIATAAFGSYLHPKVQILRDFRDGYLMKSEAGRAFVTTYYRLSPPIAAVVSRHEVLRALFRLVLLPLIAAVQHPFWAIMILLGIGTGGTVAIMRLSATKRSVVT